LSSNVESVRISARDEGFDKARERYSTAIQYLFGKDPIFMREDFPTYKPDLLDALNVVGAIWFGCKVEDLPSQLKLDPQYVSKILRRWQECAVLDDDCAVIRDFDPPVDDIILTLWAFAYVGLIAPIPTEVAVTLPPSPVEEPKVEQIVISILLAVREVWSFNIDELTGLISRIQGKPVSLKTVWYVCNKNKLVKSLLTRTTDPSRGHGGKPQIYRINVPETRRLREDFREKNVLDTYYSLAKERIDAIRMLPLNDEFLEYVSRSQGVMPESDIGRFKAKDQ